MNMPEIRFKDFKNEWKHFSFKEITYKAGIKNSENLSLESYSISNELGFIPQKEQFENGGTMSKADKRMYYIVSSNSFAYNPARINVGSLGYYQGLKDVIVSSLYEVFKTSDIVDDLFLLYWFKTNIFKRMIEQYQEGGVRLYFFFDKLQKCQIKIPSLQEQQKISSYFQKLDSLIQTTSKKLTSLKQIKAASLQSMFPQEGETVPKVRFKGFEGGWDNNLISNVCKIITGKSNTQDQVKNGLYPFFIRSENIVRSNKYLYDCEAVITIGDGNIGRVFHYINGKFDLHQRCYMMRNFRNVSALYFYYYFSAFFYDRAIKMSAKATVDSVRLNMIADMNILYPKNKLEQQKIASYFCNLDKQISLQTQRLEKLKQIKAACLDKMFV